MSTRGSRLAANALLSAGSLLVLALALGALEGGLRLAGLGDPDASGASALKYQQIFLPILEPATRPDGSATLQTADPRLPHQSILREKPADGLRVFVFGGSATAGLGFSPNVSFARHLERMLRAAHPRRTIEVVNLGIVALSSRQVRILVEHVCASYAPDLVVVYSGNNEFLELHARKYADAHATLASRAAGRVSETNLYRTLTRAFGRERRGASMAGQALSHDDLRLTQAEIIRDVTLTPVEIAQVLDAYQANVEAMTRAAAGNDTQILLMSVASNWAWRGRSDLPESWVSDLLGEDGPPTPARYTRARRVLDEKLRDPAVPDRHEWLFRRAEAHAWLGDRESARLDYRAAMNADPHLRRALDAANDRVRAVSARTGAHYLDTVAGLAARAPDGIVGFDAFYDYVHLTPRGAVMVAAEIFRALPDDARGDGTFDVDAYTHAELEALSTLESDPLAVDRWLGFGFDPAGISDRDLWKYDELLIALDERLERDPEDLRARVYRGNAAFFQHDGAARAERDYRAALESEQAPPEVRTNLDALLRGRTP